MPCQSQNSNPSAETKTMTLGWRMVKIPRDLVDLHIVMFDKKVGQIYKKKFFSTPAEKKDQDEIIDPEHLRRANLQISMFGDVEYIDKRRRKFVTPKLVAKEKRVKRQQRFIEEDEEDVFEDARSNAVCLSEISCVHSVRDPLRCPCMKRFLDFKRYWIVGQQEAAVLNMIASEITALIEMKAFSVLESYSRVRHVLAAISLDEDEIVFVNVDQKLVRSSIAKIRMAFHVATDFDVVFEAHGVTDQVKEWLERVKQMLVPEKNPLETIRATVSKVKDSVMGFIGLVSDIMTKALDKIFGYLAGFLIKIFDPLKFVNECLRNEAKNEIIAWIVYVLVIMILAALFIIGLVAMYTVLDCFRLRFWPSSYEYVDKPYVERYEAHGASSTQGVVISIITMVAICFGASGSGVDSISRKFTQLFSVYRGASAMVGVATALLVLLPEALRSIMMATFGTVEDKDALLIEDWMARATALHRLKRINRVLTSPEYYSWARELVTEAQTLRTQIKSSVVGNQFVRMLTQIMDVLAILENYRKEKPYRDMPFSIHLAANPGVGKTLISSRILTDVTDMDPSEIYTVPVSSEYWDGYHEQKLVVMDEFLIGDSITQIQTAKVYLELISTKCFKPPMASVDDPSVGLKGTTAEPKVVLTVNNDLYTRIDGVPDAAIYRRRNVVALARIAEKYKDKCVGATIDLKQLSEDELKHKRWMEFILCPPEPFKGDKSPPITYDMFIQHLRDSYATHLEMCSRIRVDVQGYIEDDKTVTELFEETLRDIRGTPKKTNVFDCFARFFTTPAGDLDAHCATHPMNEQSGKSDEDDQEAGPSFEWTKDMEQILMSIGLIRASVSDEKNSLRIRELVDRINEAGAVGQWNAGWQQIEDRLVHQCEIMVPHIPIPPIIGLKRDSIYSDDPPTVNNMQKNIVAAWDHSNVEPTMLHRHECLCVLELDEGRPVYCQRQFSHKHKDAKSHDMRCKECIQAGRKFSWNAMTPPLPPYDHGYKPSSMPEFVDYAYAGEPDEVRRDLQQVWMAIAFDHFKRFGTVPLIKLNWCETIYAAPLGPTCYEQLKLTARYLMYGFCLYFLIVGAIYIWNKFIKGVEPENEEILFAHSKRPDHETSTRTRRIKWSRGTLKAHATEVLTYSLDGGALWHRAIPLKGTSFITFAHGVLNLLPKKGEEKTILVNWAGKVYETLLSLEQIVISIEDDVLFITLRPSKMQTFKNIVSKFWTRSDMESFQSQPVSVDCSENNLYSQCSMVTGKVYVCGQKKYHPFMSLAYIGKANKGDCGTPIVAAGTSHPGKILGMHIAGGASAEGTPVCLGIPLSQEDIIEALAPQKMDGLPQEYEAHGKANLEKEIRVPRDEQVYMNNRTKLSPSCMAKQLPFISKKQLPILSNDDPRAEGVNVLDRMVDELAEHDPEIEVDDIVESTIDDMQLFYKEHLKFPIGKRDLTWEECLKGVPMKLSSLKMKTSAGYPLCKVSAKPGKKDFFWFDDNGELNYDPKFKMMVELEEIKILKGISDHRFLAFMKDELTSASKIRDKRIRLIYCADLRHNVVWRKYYGCLLSAFNQSWSTTPMMIGLNPNSYDMDVIYQRLHEVGGAQNLFAGDFKGFDKRYLRYVTEQLYDLILSLRPDVPENVQKVFKQEQAHSPIQIADRLIWLIAFQASGGLFTTVLNCLTSDFYLRWSFKYIMRQNTLPFVFDEEVRHVLLGDDHVVSVSERVKEFFHPIAVRDALTKIHQIYTSDDKQAELTNTFRSFEEVTFLGCHPRMYNGRWMGALKKEIIQDMLLWTRNGNRTFLQEAKTALEFSSAWGEEYYMYIRQLVMPFLKQYYDYDLPSVSWKTMVSIVANRTASASQFSPVCFFGHGPERSVVSVNSIHSVESENRTRVSTNLVSNVLGDEKATISFGTESLILRDEIEWKTSDPVGKAIWSSSLPLELLRRTTENTIQNMPFQRFCFYNYDSLTVTIQINASPFQNGLLACYFMPHCKFETELANITSTNHVLIQPDQSATCDLIIPYVYMKPVLSTLNDSDIVGSVFITPIAALRNTDIPSLTLSVYLSFQGARFYIPRPVSMQAIDYVRRTVEGVEIFEAQGNVSSSVTNIKNTVMGSAPNQRVESGTRTSAEQTVSPETSIPMPLDNPPLASGAVPVEQAFPGMAVSYGVRSTRDLQLMPAALNREHMKVFDPSETRIDSLLARPCLLTTFQVKKTDPASTRVLFLTLDSTFSTAGNGIPVNVAILNQFMFWRCDVELTFMAVQTRYHSMRLQLVVAYGAQDVQTADRSASYSSMMNFSQDNFKHSEIIPWNAQTEFLRTYEGSSQFETSYNYSLGKLGVFLQNVLRAPTNVSPEVDVLVFIRLLNPKVAVPRPSPLFYWSNLSYGTLELDYQDPVLKAGTYLSVKQQHPVGKQVGVYEIGGKVFFLVTADNFQSLALPGFYVPSIPTAVMYVPNDTSVAAIKWNLLSLTTDSSNTYYIISFSHPGTIVYPGALAVTGDVAWRKADAYYEAQGAEDPNTVEEKTNEAISDPPSDVLTSETDERPSIPCTIELSRKFEFTVTDIHEIARRYVFCDFRAGMYAVTSDLSLNGLKGSNRSNSVMPYSMWSLLFAGWAGSMKYRFYTLSDSFPSQISFVPFISDAGPTVPFVFETEASTNTYRGQNFNGLKYSFATPLALDVAYPISKTNYIDVSVPFQSHYSYVMTQTFLVGQSHTCGTISYSYVQQDSNDVRVPVVYTAFGDDLRLGLFRPPARCIFDPKRVSNGMGGVF